MNDDIQTILETSGPVMPEAYFDQLRNMFILRDAKGEHMLQNETQMTRHLRLAGFSGKIPKNLTSSEVDRALGLIQSERNVHFAGPLAGYGEGLREFGGKRVLVTVGPRIIGPVEGPFETLKALFGGVLGEEQAGYFYGWLKVGYEALRRQEPRPGQAVVFCGPADCGKSLIQNLVTEILGGRSAKPYQTMTGGTAFNADLFGAEHLTVEDEQPSTDIRARRNFGNQIKMVTVNEWQRLHAKHRDALMLKTLWRLTVSINDETENLLVLPPLDDSVRDKMMIFHAKRPDAGFDTATPEKRAAYWAKLTGELPAFLHWLTARFEIPSGLSCTRFGIKGYLNPEIVRALSEQAPEVQLLRLIDACFFTPPVIIGGGQVSSVQPGEISQTAEEIASAMTGINSNVQHEARRLFSWPGACGVYLGRLKVLYPARVRQERSSCSRVWVIRRPEEAGEATEREVNA